MLKFFKSLIFACSIIASIVTVVFLGSEVVGVIPYIIGLIILGVTGILYWVDVFTQLLSKKEPQK